MSKRLDFNVVAKKSRIDMKGIYTKLMLLTIIATLFVAGCQDPQEIYVEAVKLDEAGQSDQALETLDKAINVDSGFSQAYSLKGDIFQKQGKLEESSDAYEQAVKYNPFSFKDLYNLGKVNYAMDRYEKAVGAFIRALELHPESYDANYFTARTYYKLEDYENALNYATEARLLDPDNTELEILFGDIYTATSNYETAIAEYRRALEREGNKVEIMIPLGLAYIRSGNFDVARELLNETIRVAPDDFRIYQYLGYLDLRTKDFDGSIENYRVASSLRPGDQLTLKGSGVAYILKGFRDKDGVLKDRGVEQWRVALRLQPNQPGLTRLIRKYAKVVIE